MLEFDNYINMSIMHIFKLDLNENNKQIPNSLGLG